MKDGIYYIENTTDNYHSSPSAYFKTLEEAKAALRFFSDWWFDKGTGRIYFQPFGFYLKTDTYESFTRVLTYKPSPIFVCRGMGLDQDGNVIFSNEAF
ncbi:MAG: hypothetical protein J6Y02_20245 [Pseudobutyrivibrio sp.]|nr:hypothetical protein [Pseudobutyrivibrio sp.]